MIKYIIHFAIRGLFLPRVVSPTQYIQGDLKRHSNGSRGGLLPRLLPFGAASILVVSAFVVLPVVIAQSADPKLQLHEDLAQLSSEIEALRSALRSTRTEEQTLEREVRLYDQEIHRTELSIQRSEGALTGLRSEIASIVDKVAVFEREVDHAHGVLGVLLQVFAENDALPPFALLFSGKTLSQVADELAANERLQEELGSELLRLHDAEALLAVERQALSERQVLEEEAQRLLVIERDELQIKRTLREELLLETRGKTQAFTQRIRADETNIARIKAQLYSLADLGKALPFGEAYAMAKPIADATGIRPAFLLAVLQKESRIGASVGTGNWRVDMHPRDWDAFLSITQELGMDPDRVPVSRKPSYGWGGAMGPAQFLPSTWLGYRDRILEMTGHNPPSPWDIEDAFAASALKLAAGGATAKTPDAEWKSAMLYFAGGNWRNPAYSFYGDAVEDLSAIFQQQIDILEQEVQNTGT